MAKFRKKPVVIEAERWWPGVSIDGVKEESLQLNGKAVAYGMVETLEGWMRATPGDYIITGVKGEKYPCKPDIFEATYDPVES